MHSPAEVAQILISVGKKKAETSGGRLLVLGVLAGFFIAFAAIGASVASCTVESGSVAKLISAVVFPGGLAMVLVAGSELFTGNTLMTVALAERVISLGAMLRNWLLVYIGNFIGSLMGTALFCLGGRLDLFGGKMALYAIETAAAKCSLGFGPALLLGIGCNFLVCVAVLMSYGAGDVTGKIAGLFFPIMLFILAGFEHSVANMTYIPLGLFAEMNASYAAAAAGTDLAALTWGNFLLGNLLPVTLGNIIGGSVLVGGIWWFSYLRKGKAGERSE
ncbi:MAG: formate/nitrite transporter family protein [Bacillota bacterium]|nr:formate/nitrite transporter family protein [Bacillota bacterium]